MIVRIYVFIVILYSCLVPNYNGVEKEKTILIVYHVGTPPWQRSQLLEIKMEVNISGKQCLQGIYGVLEQMSQRTVEGIVVNVYSGKNVMDKNVRQFCQRIVEKVKSEW